MDKNRYRGQNLLETINNVAIWGIIASMIIGMIFAGRDFIWYVLGAIVLYGVVYYLMQREIELRYYRNHGGERWVEGNLDEAEGKGEEFSFCIQEFYKWEAMTPYEKQLIEEFVKEQEQRALEIDHEQQIVSELVKQIIIENKGMKQLDQKREEED